ncbi:MAG: SIS domain-containing protein [Clostridiales bacterium]|nr:MAG: SIS domain-containing protein [Clostridiales bacterium]
MKNEFYERYPMLKENEDKIEKVIEAIINAYNNGGTVLLCGNGGSESDCDHIVGEFMKGFYAQKTVQGRGQGRDCKSVRHGGRGEKNFQYAVPAISLPSLSAVNTAFINDVAPDFCVCAAYVRLRQKGDVAIGISTSGNSKNVVNALIAAKAKRNVHRCAHGCKNPTVRRKSPTLR